jgi:hypothetical protein
MSDATDDRPAGEPAPDPQDLPLDDLSLDAAPEVDVKGGQPSNWTPLSGAILRPSHVGAYRGEHGHVAKHASGEVWKKIAADRAPKAPAKATIIIGTRWLAENKKRPGDWKRAEGGIEGETVRLEVSVNTSQAPSGTPATFAIFQLMTGADDAPLGSASGVVKDGVATADWVCACLETPDGKEPQLFFRAHVKGDEARSTMLPVESYVDVVFENPDGTPHPGKYRLKLPHRPETTGETDKEGHVRVKCAPGRFEIALAQESA